MPELEVTVQPTAAPSAEPWKELGFDDPVKAIEAFKTLKADHGKLKGTAKEQTAALAELETLRQEKARRDEAEMTEAQKAQARAVALEAEVKALKDAGLAKDRAILFERERSGRLATYPEDVRALVADSYELAIGKGFADAKELSDLLDEADKKWQPIAMRFDKAGGGGGSGQAPRISATGAPVAQQGQANAFRDLHSMSLGKLVGWKKG